MNSNKRDLMTDIMQRVSPALALFAYRALQDSHRLGIKQLFFIAREGIFLKAVFSHMTKQFPELQKLFPHNKQFKVLYTSRSASIVGRYAKPDNIADIVSIYERDSKAVGEIVKASWADEQLDDEIEMYGQKMKKGFVLAVLIAHQTHHRGQITVLMRQAGLRVPGIYGPAKEDWKELGMPAVA